MRVSFFFWHFLIHHHHHNYIFMPIKLSIKEPSQKKMFSTSTSFKMLGLLRIIKRKFCANLHSSALMVPSPVFILTVTAAYWAGKCFQATVMVETVLDCVMSNSEVITESCSGWCIPAPPRHLLSRIYCNLLWILVSHRVGLASEQCMKGDLK